MNKLKVSQVQFSASHLPNFNSKLLEQNFNKAIKFKPHLICTPECSNIITNDKNYLHILETRPSNDASKVWIKFFPCLVLTPVFPPIEESTWDKRVVGILINFNPLLNRLAAKPQISPVIPPPTEIKQSLLEKFPLP